MKKNNKLLIPKLVNGNEDLTNIIKKKTMKLFKFCKMKIKIGKINLKKYRKKMKN